MSKQLFDDGSGACDLDYPSMEKDVAELGPRGTLKIAKRRTSAWKARSADEASDDDEKPSRRSFLKKAAAKVIARLPKDKLPKNLSLASLALQAKNPIQSWKHFQQCYNTFVAKHDSNGRGFELAYSQVPEVERQFVRAGLFSVSDKRSIACSVRINTLANADVMTSTFFVEGDVTVRWFDEALASVEFNTELAWGNVESLIRSPTIQNAVGTCKMAPLSPYVVVQPFPNDPPGLCTFTWRFSATCATRLNLASFPFDAQELSVEVAFNETAMPSSASFGRCMVPESQFDKNISQRSGALWRYGIEYNDLEEYDMYEPFVTAFGGALAPHTFVVSVPIVRHCRSFVLHVCLPTFFITSLSFSAFAIQATKGDSGRMQLTSAYMLAVVAFKFSIQGTLPKTAYLTQIDLYLNAAMYLNVVISAALGVGSALLVRTTYQQYFGVVLFGFWILYQVNYTVSNFLRMRRLHKRKGYAVPRKPLVLKRRRALRRVDKAGVLIQVSPASAVGKKHAKPAATGPVAAKYAAPVAPVAAAA